MIVVVVGTRLVMGEDGAAVSRRQVSVPFAISPRRRRRRTTFFRKNGERERLSRNWKYIIRGIEYASFLNGTLSRPDQFVLEIVCYGEN